MIVNVYLGVLFLKDAAFDEDEKSWTEEIISQSLNDSLIFVNTSRCAPTPSKKTSIYSNTEAAIVCHVCNLLIKVCSLLSTHLCLSTVETICCDIMILLYLKQI